MVTRMVRTFWPLGAPRLVSLTPEALAVAVAFHDEIEPTLRAEMVPGNSAGWAKKMVGAMLRIAGTLAVAADPEATEISAGQVAAAVRLIRFYETHTATVNRTLMDTALSDQLAYATRVLRSLAKLHDGGATRVSVRQVSRGVNKGRNDLSTQALQSLAELGWVIHDDRGGGDNTASWVMHPGLSQWVEKYR